jgi:hypothetical protein
MPGRKGRTVARIDFALMDAFHVTICLPPSIPPPESGVIRQALDDLGLPAHLRHAVRTVIPRWPALEKVRVFVTQ